MYLCLSVFFLFWRFQPVSGFLFWYCKSGLYIPMFVNLFCFEFMLPLPVSVLPCLLCCIILVRTFWFWLCFCVLGDYSYAFSLGISAYLIIWITTSACLLTLLLPCPIKTLFLGTLCIWVLLHLHPFTIRNTWWNFPVFTQTPGKFPENILNRTCIAWK